MQDMAGAQALLDAALAAHPRHYAGWMLRAELAARTGRNADAVRAYRQAMDVAPYLSEPLVLLGLFLEEAGDASAEALLDRAVRMARVQSAEVAMQVLERITQNRLQRKDGRRAFQSIEAALHLAAGEKASQEKISALMLWRGEALLLMGDQDRAWRALTAASMATDERTLSRLGEVSCNHGLVAEAEEVFRKVALLHPQSGYAHFNLGKLLATRWKVVEAQQALNVAERLLVAAGDRRVVDQIDIVRAEMHWRSGNADAAFKAFSQLNGRMAGHSEIPASVAMTSLYDDAIGPAEVLDIHRRLFASLGAGARSVSSFRRAALAGRRLRVGFIGSDMKTHHPVNIFIQPILREMDRGRVETFFYNGGNGLDAAARLGRLRVEHWADVDKWSDERLAARIDEDQIDVIIDLSGHTGTNRAAMLARRVAPVQAIYLGYPGTTGLPNMDWLIADHIVAPEGADKFYSEQVYRLPGTVFCFAPEDDFPLPDFSARRDAPSVVFGAIHNAPKLNALTLGLFARVLQAVPTARLKLQAPSFVDAAAISYFRERICAHGIAAERLAFLPPMPLPEMMAGLADVDILLDAFPYGGGTTTHQALWMGVPAVTLAGEGFASRMGASILAAAGLADWVAQDAEAYVAIAAGKAADRAGLHALRAGLRARLMAAPAWDVKAHTAAFVDGLLAMAQTKPRNAT